MRLDIIVPCHNEEEVLPLFYAECGKVLAEIRKEKDIESSFIFVDDGSKDNTLKLLKEFHEKDPFVRFISFSRNFGKEAAMYAGLQASEGDFVVIMDADLQDPPSFLPKMLDALLEEGYDCAAARRSDRKGEPAVRSWFASKFYKLINHSASTKIEEGARDFRMMTRQMKDAVLELSEYNRFSKGIFSWVGFHTKWLPYENVNRAAGKTKWSFKALSYYAIDGIVGFTVKPLEIAAWFGMIFFLLSIIGILFIIVRKLLFGDPVAGWPSLVCIVLFCSGIQLFCTGIIGEYLAKTYIEVKKRPLYIVRETEKGKP
ncbi:MAG: glycosyltransferase family 2 protein [Solobacterium sp.]|nr:glycosyltransferase family 2 protein [Solobacterium sp.]